MADLISVTDLETIDAEIRRLERAKELLKYEGGSTKRTMSPERRARVAAAQRARWAKAKRAGK